jgi:beta-lactamase class A
MTSRHQPKNVTINRSLLFIVVAAAFAFGVFVGRGTWLFGTGHEHRGGEYSDGTSEDFRFIRQSILQDLPPDARKVGELKPFRYKVMTLIDEKLGDEEVQSVSLYFRDLDNGNWFGIADNEPFSPEGQLKIPLMIAYFKWAETNPLVLRKKLVLAPGKEGTKPRFLKPPRSLEPGTSYTVNELIFRMAANGDSDAYVLLKENLPPVHLQRIYKDLYVNYDPSKKEDVLSLSAYASFFRVLFNASYLSEEVSEKALRILSRAAFQDGMVAGVPPDVDIASKAGERVLPPGGADGEEEVLQLHEFGIIYHPMRPFLLGITVRGDDYETLAKAVRDITRLIYAEVDRQSED